MLGALVFERDPLTLADIPAGVKVWFQVVGGFAFLGIVLWLLLGYSRRRQRDRDRIPRWLKLSFGGLCLLGVAADSVAAVFGLLSLAREPGDRAGSFAADTAYNL